MNNTSDSSISISYDYINITETSPTYTHSLVTFADILSPEMLAYVPKHWLQYEAPSCLTHYLIGVLYIFIFIPGFIGNSVVIYLFFKCRSLRSSSNVFLLNLAFSDILMNSKMPLFILNSFSCGPITGVFGCELYGFIGGISGTNAIMSIAVMSIDRYRAISNPLNPRMSTRRSIWISISVWIYSFIFSGPPLFGLINRYVPEGYLTSCSFDYLSEDFGSRFYIFVFFIGAFCVPITIIAYSYISIVFVVKKSRIVFNESKTVGSNFANLQNQRNNEIKLAKIAFCLITLWVLSWSPYAIVALIGIFGNHSLLTPTASMIPALFAKSSGFVNPYVYALSHPKFKTEIKKNFFKGMVTEEERTEQMSLSMRGSTKGSFTEKKSVTDF